MPLPASRVPVLGSLISACSLDAALARVTARIASGEGGYVCFTNVHTVVMGRQDPEFRAVTNGSFLSLADGKPVYWVARLRSREAGHAPGPDFFLHALERTAGRRHFLYGSTPETLDRLANALEARIPGLRFCGRLSPPFRALTETDLQDHYRIIRESGAEFVWVGLGAPKQEKWMAEAQAALAPAVLFGVGAAFDFHAGTVRRAPAPLRALGLEWLHRLLQEPRRLWRRYLIANSLFVYYLLTDRWTGHRAPPGPLKPLG